MTMNKQERTQRTEDEAMLDFQRSQLTWKTWAIVAAVNAVAYVFFVGFAKIFGW